MDYPNRTRFKLLGRVQMVGQEESELLAELEVDSYRAQVERGVIIHIEAFDWNCPQHITPRYTDTYINTLMASLIEQNQELRPRQDYVDISGLEVLGGGSLELVISGVRQLTPRVRAYELRDPNGEELPALEAGSHLQFTMQLSGGETRACHYSICSNPARRDTYEIAVLREDGGKGGSLAVHSQFSIGRRLNTEPPRNHFRLHSGSRPAVLIAGGIGITPIKAMAQLLKARSNDFQFHYSGRSKPEMAFCDRLQRELGDELTIYSSADNERLDIVQVLSSMAVDAVVYVCGPSGLIDTVVNVAAKLDIDPARVRFERFVANVAVDARPIQVELRRSGKQIEVGADQTILDAMLDAGIESPYSCKAGNCKSCAVKVMDGEPEHMDSALSADEREDYHLMCPCVSRAKGECLVLDI